METIIESTNFEPSKALNDFIREKAQAFLKLDKNALFAEFNLAAAKQKHSCTLILNLPGKDIVASRTTENMYNSVLKVIDAAKRGMRKKKMKKLRFKKKR